MSGFLNLVCSICIIVITVALFENLITDSKFKQPLKVLTGAIIAVCVINAVTSAEIDTNDFDFSKTSVNYSKDIAKSYARIVSGILEANGITSSKILIDTSISDNKDIQLDKVTIKSNQFVDKAKISKEIDAVLNVQTQFCEEWYAKT